MNETVKDRPDKDSTADEAANSIAKTESNYVGDVIVPDKAFNMLSALGIAYSITNSPLGILLALGSQMYFGGAPAYFYGFIIMALVGACVAVSLGELTSMYPHSGGQYHWVVRLCPSSSRRLLSYITAILAWASAVATGASACLACTQIILGMVRLEHPSYADHEKPWMVFLTYQAVNLALLPVNCFEKSLPYFSRFALMIAISGTLVIFVSVLAASPTKQSAAFFFTDFHNLSGWPTSTAFWIGINLANWNFSCLDAATHLVDEVPNPRRDIPKTLLLTVLIGFLAGVPILMAMYFSIQSVDDALNGVSGIFSMEIFYQAFSGNKAAALGLEALVLTPGLCSIIGIHTWQSRLAWALSRDRGFPFYKYLSSVAPAPLGAPVWAHVWSCLWTAICGCVYLASYTAFSSLVSAGIVLQYLTYSTAIILLLRKGRSNVPHGPFWYPRLGLLCNIVVVLWTIAATVLYCLPYFRPVTASSMNYVSVILVVVIIYALGYWLLVGKKHYTVPQDYEDAE